jgi:hypothetical protein
MYVRRFLPAPADDIDRFRARFGVARPIHVRGRIYKPFASYEKYYERIAGWNRQRLWSGITLQLTKNVFVQPSYLWETADRSRDINYLLVGLIIKIK